MRSLGATIITAGLLASISQPAFGQSGAPELDRNANAVDAGRRGLEAFRVGDWPAAYEAFHEAEGIAHSPVFLLYMARVRQRQGATAEALDLFARVGAEPVSDATPEPWKAAIAQAAVEAAELRQELSRAKARQIAPELPELPRVKRSKRRLEPAAEPKAPWTDEVALASGITGAAALVLGATAGIVAKLKLDGIEARCSPEGCDPADKPELERVHTWEQVANVSFILAGTGLASAGVFLWLVPANPNGRTKPMSAGVSTHFRF